MHSANTFCPMRFALKSNFPFIAQNDSRVRVSLKELFAHEILMSTRMKCVEKMRTICQFHQTLTPLMCFCFWRGTTKLPSQTLNCSDVAKHSFCQTFRNTQIGIQIEWKFYVTLAAATVIWCHVITRYGIFLLLRISCTLLPLCMHRTCLSVCDL